MKLNNNSLFALLLIGCGVLILLGKIGIGFGSVAGLVIPIALIVLGYIGIKNGSKFFGWVFLVFGLIALLGKLSGFLGILFAIALIYFGISMLKNRSRVY